MLEEEKEKIKEETRNASKRKQLRKTVKLKDQLMRYQGAIFELMQESQSLASLQEGIESLGKFKVSKVTLMNFMRERYPELYQQNYSSRAPKKAQEGLRKKRELTLKKNDLSVGSKEKKEEVVETKTPQKRQAKTKKEIEDMVKRFEENMSK